MSKKKKVCVGGLTVRYDVDLTKITLAELRKEVKQAIKHRDKGIPITDDEKY